MNEVMIAVSALPLESLDGALGFIRSLAHGKRGVVARVSHVFFDGMPKTRAAADAVLIASDRADLDDRLDEMFVGLLEFGSELETLVNSRIENLEDEEALQYVLGRASAAKLEAACARALPRFESLSQRLEGVRPKAERDSSETWSAMVDIAYQPSLPLAAREAYVEVWHGIVAGVVIMRAVELGCRLDPWFALALAEVVSLAIEKGLASLELLLEALAPGGLESIVERFSAHFVDAKRYEDYLTSFYGSSAPQTT